MATIREALEELTHALEEAHTHLEFVECHTDSLAEAFEEATGDDLEALPSTGLMSGRTLVEELLRRSQSLVESLRLDEMADLLDEAKNVLEMFEEE